MLKKIVLFAVKIYQAAVSPIYGSCCRFHPSCSEYFSGSVSRNGVLKGSLKGFYRILRCNPFNPGGYDPVVKE